MAKISFDEIFRMGGDKESQKLKHYFQPKMLLNGRSLCSLEFNKLRLSLNPLIKALAYDAENLPINI